MRIRNRKHTPSALATVKVNRRVLEAARRFIKLAKNEYHVRKFRSLSDITTKALEEFAPLREFIQREHQEQMPVEAR